MYGKAVHVLLIEDNPDDADLIRELLSSSLRTRFNLETIPRLSIGLERLAQGGIDAVLLDLGLPDSQGIDTVDRATTEAPGVPIIVLTGLTDEAAGIEAVQKGAQDYLMKGEVDEKLLERAIHYAIERKRTEVELQKHRDHLEAMVEERTAALRAANQHLMMMRRVDSDLTRRLDVSYVATIGLDAAMRVTLADCAYVALAKDDGIRILHGIGDFPRQLVNQLIPSEDCVSARVIRTQQAELILDVARDPDYYERVPSTRGQMVIPLVSSGQMVGLLTLETRDPARFTFESFEIIKLLSGRMAVAIDNAHMYEERERLVEELDAYACTVAHDLKNPLTLIGSYGALILEEYRRLSDDELEEFAGMIVKFSHKMTNIINELLLFAGVRKMATVKIGPLDMAAIVAEAQTRFANLIAEGKAEIVLPEAWPVAVGYAPWVEEVWANYISNAIQYGSIPPCVKLGAAREDNRMVRFWVQDNGDGIPPDKLPHLFNQFMRLDEMRAEGHGLGLSIVQRIVARLGGEVCAESTIGQGSTFSFTLPAAK